jgi:hypothetical protein
VGPSLVGYTGRSDLYDVIGRSNDYTVVVCGVYTQVHSQRITVGGGAR